MTRAEPGKAANHSAGAGPSGGAARQSRSGRRENRNGRRLRLAAPSSPPFSCGAAPGAAPRRVLLLERRSAEGVRFPPGMRLLLGCELLSDSASCFLSCLKGGFDVGREVTNGTQSSVVAKRSVEVVWKTTVQHRTLQKHTHVKEKPHVGSYFISTSCKM